MSEMWETNSNKHVKVKPDGESYVDEIWTTKRLEKGYLNASWLRVVGG